MSYFRTALQGLIEDGVVYGVIILNAIVLTLQTFQVFSPAVLFYFYVIDYACTVFFVVEIALKIILQSLSTFWAGWWNRFDFVIVAISSPMLLGPLVEFDWIGLVLTLRVARLFRLLRLFHFIPNIDNIWAGIRRALVASVGVFYAFFVYLFILTLISTYLFQDVAPAYFANPVHSLYSIFRLLTVEGWYEIPNGIARNSSQGMAVFAKVYFSFVVFTAGIFGLSIANAVFVDEMVEDNTDELEERVAAMQDQLDRIDDRLQGQGN